MAKIKVQKNNKKNANKGGKAKKKIKIPVKVLGFLENCDVKHEILEHRTVYTAIDAAMTMKKKINEIAKSLLVKADKDYYLVILPADNNLDFEKLKKEINKNREKPVKAIKIPGEKMMEKALKVKVGAMAAFGQLYKVGVIVDKKLAKLKKAVFASGSHNYSIEMAVRDFVELEGAILASFGVKKKIVKQKVIKGKRKKV